MSHDPDEHGLPSSHPRYQAHFIDPIYDDVSDEFAPFATDEGADVLAEWANRRWELNDSTTLRDLLAEDFEDLDEFFDSQSSAADVGLDAMIIGAGFTLLRFTGQIDDEGRSVLGGALRRTIDFYGPHITLERMLDDLRSYAS